ncbi:MAG: hypothetical protein D8M59_14755 [Planctomycetes bacterium]|nr:hypothetical protein [Planctomycetota bacterium]
MCSWLRTLGFGFLVWLIPFVVAVGLSGVRETNRPLFESIMPVVVTVSVVACSLIYFPHVRSEWAKEAARLGVIWMIISLVIDLPLMLNPPISMTCIEYIHDVGITYLIIPAVTVGMGLAIGRANRASGDGAA